MIDGVTVKDFVTSMVAVVKEFRSKSHCCSFDQAVQELDVSDFVGQHARASRPSNENVNYPATVLLESSFAFRWTY